ncbi:MAG: hypothetical protein K2H13_09010 [Eubacterium sp.]|nr:hypothetical protein [Eubacterium sp.]
MKSVLFNILKSILTVVKFVFVIIGSIGAFLSVLLLLLCIFGLLLNAVIGGWDKAFDLTLMPLLVSLGAVFGFSILRALGTLGNDK